MGISAWIVRYLMLNHCYTGKHKFYCNCSKVARIPIIKRCDYRKFVPGAWDDAVWDCVYALLRDESLIQKQLSVVTKQNQGTEKLIRLESQKIAQAQAKIAKMREGFEGGLYTMDEAKSKVAFYQSAINRAEQEIQRLRGSTENQGSMLNIDALKEELEKLA